ncbi:natural killer cell receptor 2B4-like [Megalops cyprinoides]|uniref:natural killer cell receptor 2B4-like n=1 Tax=Megalops cyprinoides TaxID=118141 RepID=UPI001864D768|nr:natural killer cell receptor 2B4-like [Megalops cyprinoides]
MFWKFNKTTNVVEYIRRYNETEIYGNYKNRVEFDQRNLSLLLKNMQERDSGIYTAIITDERGTDRDVATYTLCVQAATPKPQLSMELLFFDGGYCNVSVNCSAKDDWVSYTCDHAHCTQVASKTPPSGLIIIVTATNGTIHCNSSNRVSMETQSKPMKDICEKKEGTTSPDSVTNIIVAIVILLIGIVIVIAIVIIYIRKRSQRGGSQISQCNTEYASVEAQQQQQRSSTPAVEFASTYDTVRTAESQRPPEETTVYHTVGQVGAPPPKPETIYATVNKSGSK